MATVVLKDDHIRLKAPAGTSLRKIALSAGASMPFGCRVGECTSCAATVEAGMEYLTPLTEKETKMLAMVGAQDGNVRFMCQCSVATDEGEIVISYGIGGGA